MAEKNIRNIGSAMPQAETRVWIANYQKQNPEGLHGNLFGADILEKMLADKGCEGIWFFKGISDQGKETLVLLPTDKEGNILPDSAKNEQGNGDEFVGGADYSTVCPPDCPTV